MASGPVDLLVHFIHDVFGGKNFSFVTSAGFLFFFRFGDTGLNEISILTCDVFDLNFVFWAMIFVRIGGPENVVGSVGSSLCAVC